MTAPAPYWTVRAYASWADVERGRIAHDSRHDTAAEARAVYDALPYPVADLIRHDPDLDGPHGGRPLTGRSPSFPDGH